MLQCIIFYISVIMLYFTYKYYIKYMIELIEYL